MESTSGRSYPMGKSPYLDLFDEVEDIVIFLDQDLNVRSANLSTTLHTGYSRQDIIGRSFEELFHVVLPDGQTIDIKDNLETNYDSVQLELMTDPDMGNSRFIEARVFLIENGEGERVYLLIGKIIPEGSRLSVELERLKEDQNVLLENSTDCVLIINNGEVEKANLKAMETLGYSSPEICGMKITDFFFEKRMESLDGIIPKDVREGFEGLPCRRKDGSVFPAEINLITFELNDNERGFLFIKDVADKKKREEKLRLLAGIIETSEDAVLVLDPNGDPVTVNSGFKKIFLLESLEAGWDPKDMLGGSDEKYLEMMSSLMEGMNWSGYSSVNIKDRALDISIKAWPMTDSSGNVDYLIIHCRDVSDIRRIHSDMELLSSILSHDIRNFDKAITDNLTLLKMGVYGKLDEEKAGVIDRILNQSRGMNSLITNSRKVLQSYREVDGLEVFDLRSVVLYTSDLIRLSYPERKIEIDVEFFDPPPLVRADVLIRDIFQNLFDNSVKYSDGDVRISVEGSDTNEGWYTVLVRDDGIGLPQGKRDDLFSLFKGTHKVSGTGMGLYLVKRLMERFGGRVSSDDVVGNEGYSGACFRLDFPRLKNRSSIICDTINNDLSDPVRYLLFRKYCKEGKEFMEFGGYSHEISDLESAGKIELIERFGWNISRAIYDTIRFAGDEGVYRYDFQKNEITGPMDPKEYGDGK